MCQWQTYGGLMARPYIIDWSPFLAISLCILQTPSSTPVFSWCPKLCPLSGHQAYRQRGANVLMPLDPRAQISPNAPQHLLGVGASDCRRQWVPIDISAQINAIDEGPGILLIYMLRNEYHMILLLADQTHCRSPIFFFNSAMSSIAITICGVYIISKLPASCRASKIQK